MSKPKQTTRDLDKYKRQLKILEMYLTGRIMQLNQIAETQLAEQPMCDMATSELQLILTQVLPLMQEVQA